MGCLPVRRPARGHMRTGAGDRRQGGQRIDNPGGEAGEGLLGSFRLELVLLNSLGPNLLGFPAGSVVQTLAANRTPGSERSPGEGSGNPLQYSCLAMDRGAWHTTVHAVSKELGRTKQLNNHHHNLSTWFTAKHVTTALETLDKLFHSLVLSSNRQGSHTKETSCQPQALPGDVVGGLGAALVPAWMPLLLKALLY